jgi:hypothetical protein
MKSGFKHVLKGLLITVMLACQPASANAGDWLNSGTYQPLFHSSYSLESALGGLNGLIVKSKQAYDESQDPAMHKSSPPDEGPKHGFFAVSAVVIGIFGLFIYFLRVD